MCLARDFFKGLLFIHTIELQLVFDRAIFISTHHFTYARTVRIFIRKTLHEHNGMPKSIFLKTDIVFSCPSIKQEKYIRNDANGVRFA